MCVIPTENIIRFAIGCIVGCIVGEFVAEFIKSLLTGKDLSSIIERTPCNLLIYYFGLQYIVIIALKLIFHLPNVDEANERVVDSETIPVDPIDFICNKCYSDNISVTCNECGFCIINSGDVIGNIEHPLDNTIEHMD